MQTAIRQGIDKSFAAQRRRPDSPWRVWIRAGVYAAALIAVILSSACVTAPPKKQTAVEKAREETAYGAELARQFDGTVKLHGDPIVEKYLNSVAKTLADPGGDPRLLNMKVVIVLDRGGQWRTYSLPGKHVYFSLGLLQQLHYDNEVAAAIALEYGNLVQSNTLKHLKMQQQGVKSFLDVDPAIKLVTPQKVDFYSPEGVFAFDLDEVKLAIKDGIDILYKAGFDIRGMLQIWEIYQENPQHSPFPDKVLEELIDYTRAVFTKYAPTRNPVVRTEEFKAMQKRIMKL